MQPGHLYSLPCVRNLAVLEDVSSTTVLMADDMLHALADSVEYFEVADTNVARRKLLQTEGGTRSPPHVVPRVLAAVHVVRTHG